MSSILRALKKLEEESAAQIGSERLTPLDSRRILKRKITPIRRARRLGAVIMVLLVVGGGLFFIVGKWRTPRPAVITAANTGGKKAPARPPAITVENTRPIVRTKAPAPSFPMLPTAKAAAGNAGPVNASKRPEPTRPSSKPSGGGTASALPPAPVKKLPMTAETASLPAPADVKPLPADAGLKLQAMAWAPSPAGRFAVINSQIVREGDSVGEVTVERIDQEKVVVRKGGATYQLTY